MTVRAFESRGEYFLHILSIWCLPNVVGSRGRSGQSRARSALVDLPLGSLIWKVGIGKDKGGAQRLRSLDASQGEPSEDRAPQMIVPQSRLGCWGSVSEKHGKGD